jgi:hypothetical protein
MNRQHKSKKAGVLDITLLITLRRQVLISDMSAAATAMPAAHTLRCDRRPVKLAFAT